MLLRYLNSFLPLLVLFSAICSTLPFATRSHVPAGTTVEETWRAQLTLNTPDSRYYQVSDAIKQQLERGLAFVGSGSVRVTSARLDITPQQVSWDQDDKTMTAPGASLVAHVAWEALANSPNGAPGDIHVEFPRLSGIGSYIPDFHSGGFQKTGDGRWVFREVAAYRTRLSLLLGRFVFALYAGFPMAVFVHSLWWLWVLRGEKRARLAALPQFAADVLPRIFFPSPTAEWSAWTLVLIIFGGLGCMLAGFAIYDRFLSSVLQWVIIIFQSVGLFFALLTAWFIRATVLTVRIDDDTISLAKGRGQPHWITTRWADLQSLQTKSRVYRGTRTEWIQLRLPNGKRHNIAQHKVEDYPLLRDASLALYARHHTPAQAG